MSGDGRIKEYEEEIQSLKVLIRRYESALQSYPKELIELRDTLALREKHISFLQKKINEYEKDIYITTTYSKL